ncbi:TonB-dependent receptor [Desulfonema magnum]|uniref:TonB-dependent receptor n=1 Tax=Desulfonema magnum TaxID=45655 RepID=A0A975BU18_9BACT|nr:TonB-dependent receptor [Desulfonema magnum]
MVIILIHITCGFAEEINQTTEDELDAELKWVHAEAYAGDVVTASKKAQKISEAPATIISITQDQIEAYGWKDLKDIFRALPGVDVSYNVQGELKTLVIMRGVLGNQKILILQDGHRYSPATGERFLYGHNIPLNICKRIEIVYGPASSLYGADAYAGVINLITKTGADYDGAELNAGYISTGAYTSNLSFGKKIDDSTDFLISARVFRGEDQKLHEDYDEYAAVHSYQGNLRFLENDYPVKNWNLFFKLHYKKFTMGGDWQHVLESNAAVSLPETYAYVEDFVWGQDMRHFYVDHESYSSNTLNIRTSFLAGDYELNPATNFFVVSKDDEGNLTDGTPAYKYAYSSYLKGEIQADWDITEKMSAMAGVSYEKVVSFPKTKNLEEPFNSDGKREIDYRDFIDPNGYTFGVLGFEQPVFGERNFNNLGLFVQAEYKFSDMFKLDGGIRYDYNTIYKETVNPRLGVILDPIKNLTVKFLYGTAYIQPSNFFRYENFANPFIMHIPNENIRPEELENYSLDMSYIIRKDFAIQATAFFNKMKNIIRPVEAPAQEDNYPYYNPYRKDQGYVQYNGNQGEIESKGGELTLKHKTDRFLTSLSYSYVTGEDNEFDIPQISAHKATLNSSYTGERWIAGLTLRYYSDVSTDKNNYKYGDAEKGGDETYVFDGAFVTYLNLAYKLNDSLSLNLNVDNLFNTEHYAGVPFDGSPVLVPRTPQPLRKIYMGFKYSF